MIISMDNFADRLITAILKKQSYVIVGLDPRVDLIPKSYIPSPKSDPKSIARILLRFNKSIIDIVADGAVGVKPQSAFYEKYGWWGVRAFWETLSYAQKKNLLTIADIKRGDVPSTAQAYAEAYLDRPEIDAVTVNPFLGEDSLLPFIKAARQNGKGLFVLVKTSNPGSKDFQDKILVSLARKVADWGKELIGQKGYSSLGAVVGATFAEEARPLREIMSKQFFLVPGYGAQGATAQDIKVCFNNDGLGAVINASRSIIHAYRKPETKHWKEAVRRALLDMKQKTWSVIHQ